MIASFNNAGAQHLCRGDWKEAAACFLCAISALRRQDLAARELDMIRPSQIITASPLASTALSSFFPTQLQSDHNNLIVCPSVFQITLPSLSMTTNIVSRGVPQQEDDEIPDHENELTAMLSAVLLYNLSLAHHAYAIASQRGVRTQGYDQHEFKYYHYSCNFSHHQKSNLFEKAGRSYGRAAAVATRAPSLLREHHPLLMAIFNNWAHVSFQLFDMTKCSKCQDALQMLVSLPSPTVVVATTPTTITRDHNFASLAAAAAGSSSPSASDTVLSSRVAMSNELAAVAIQQQQVVFMNLLLLQSRMRSAPAA